MGANQSGEMGQEEWVGVVIAQLSPRVSEFGASVLTTHVEPMLQRALARRDPGEPDQDGGGERKFKFEKTELGTIPPKISNIKAHRVDRSSGQIILDFDVSYLGDCDLQVSMLGMRSGVRDVQMSGRARLVLRPLVSQVPFIGGIQFCFLDEPKIAFDFDGLADICDWPLLRRKVRKELLEDCRNHIVYPNRMSIPLTGSADPEPVRAFSPTGFFFLRVVRATGLPKKGGLRKLVGQHKPDCYADVKVGAMGFRTTVVKNSCDPVWEETEWFEFPLETLTGHFVHVRLFDEDSASRDEFMGRTTLCIKDILQGEAEIDTVLIGDSSEKSKYDEVSGDVTLTFRWLNCVDVTDESALEPTFEGQKTVALAEVFLHSANNVVSMDEHGTISQELPSTRAVISFNGEMLKSDWEKRDPHPRFLFGANFNIVSQEQLSQNIDIKIVDKEENILGELSLGLFDLLTNPMQRRMVQLNPEEKPYMTITLSAKIRAVKA